MNPFIDQMLSQVYELEGLMLVLDRHKGDSSDFIYEMVRRKVERISELAPMCTPDIFAHENAQKAMVSQVEEDENVEEIEETELEDTFVECEDECVPENDYVDQIPNDSQYVDVVEEDELFSDSEAEDYSEPIEDENEVEVEEIEEITEVEEAIEEDFEEDAFEEIDEIEEPEVKVIEVTDAEVETETDVFDEVDDFEEDEVEDIDEDEVENDDEAEEDDDFEIDSDDYADEVVTVEEALQRNLSKDLSKAFTLNDHFRYRRELFGNSEMEMRNTINMVEAMRSFAEAEEYFYGDLEWDSESLEVIDFMAIIKKHFL